MFDVKDIEIYLKAKREQLYIDILRMLSVLTLTTLIVLEAMNINHDYTIILATFSAVFMGAAFGGSRWVSVSRESLIDLIGRTISNDADALAKLAAVKNGK